ncbi:MAG: hypothetical protein RMJ84_08660 [Sandaracinaceae bacterium]|nr:hypothetical protein [Sandaracinaceae bacterium]
MLLKELSDEALALLLAWMRVIVRADGAFSSSERATVLRIQEEVGKERFLQAMKRAEGYEDVEKLKEFSKRFEGDEEKKLIFNTLEMIAKGDGISVEEDAALRWLGAWWRLR